MNDFLLSWRPEFPILGKSVYMISHSLGAMPKRARARLNEFADMWETRGIRAWEEGWWDMPVTVGNLVGSIIGAGVGEVVMHQNVSICQSIVLSCFDWTAKRNKIVSERLNFPSNIYNYEALSKGPNGPRMVYVDSEDGMTVPLDKLLAAIDEETALVSVSHVIYKSAFIQDLAAITKRAHEVGAMVFADLYQSTGTVPVDVRALHVDFATGGSVKWLCGGPGAGFLYVRRDLWPSLEPKITGWQAHKNPFAFEPGEIEYSTDILRFAHGTPNVPSMFSAMSGYEIINEVGVANIRAKSIRQTEALIAMADSAGFVVKSPRDSARRGGSIVLDVPNGYEIVKELARRDVLMDFRPGAGIRLAPHFYTTDEELSLCIESIAKVSHEFSVAA